MKRSIIGVALGTALSLMAVGSVLAWPEDTQASLSSTPAGTPPGGTWTVDVSFVSNGQILRVANLRPHPRQPKRRGRAADDRPGESVRSATPDRVRCGPAANAGCRLVGERPVGRSCGA